MKKIISGFIAVAIMAQSITLFAANSTDGESAVQLSSAGTEMISGGDFSSNITGKFSVSGGAQTVVYDDGSNNDGNPFMHIKGTRSSVDKYLEYNGGGITLQPGVYTFSFDVRHGYDNENLLGYFSGYNAYREFTVKFDLQEDKSVLGYTYKSSLSSSALKEIFGGDDYVTCEDPIAYSHAETHKLDPAGYVVFDGETEFGYYDCLAPKRHQARVGSEWRTVTKTFALTKALYLKNFRIYGGNAKDVNLASYDIDNVSLKYLGTGSVNDSRYDLNPVEGFAIKKGTPTVDGELDAAYLSSLNVNVSPEWVDANWDGSANAKTYYMYDNNYVYLFARVVDDDVIAPSAEVINGNVLYWNDAGRNGYSPILENDLFTWRLSLDGTPNLLKVTVDAYGNRVFGMENKNGEILGNGTYSKSDYDKILKATKITDFGYQIEVAVPCKLGSANVLNVNKLGLTLEIRDLDANGETGSGAFAKSGTTYNTPIFFALSSEAAAGAGSNYGSVSGAVGDYASWVLSSDGVLTISGSGAIPSYESEVDIPWVLDASYIKKVIISRGITSIGKNAFSNLTGLKAVEIGDDVRYIGAYAFRNCTSLSSITYSGAEVEWKAIAKEATWDSGAGAYTLECCGSLPTLTESGTCSTGLTWAYNNGTLTISGAGDMTDYESFGKAPWHDWSAYIKNIVISDGVTYIGDYAFALCSGVTAITIPNSVTAIGGHAFDGCSALANINLPDGVMYLGDRAFANCASLTSMEIPSDVWSIGIDAFAGCSKLQSINASAFNEECTSVDGVLYTSDMAILIYYPEGKTDSTFTVPSSVKVIGDYAFRGAVNLKSVTIPASVTGIGVGAFSGCMKLATVNLNASVSAINDYTFYYCKNLTGITLPGSVKSIGSNAFAGCRKLSSVNLDNVVSIGEAAFCDCYALKAVKLNSGLTYIGGKAFFNCVLISDIYFGASRAEWNRVTKGSLWNSAAGSNVGGYDLHIEGAVKGNCGAGVTWEVSGNILTISGTGSMDNYKEIIGGASYNYVPNGKYELNITRWAPWYDYRDEITSVVIESGVTGIGDYAFKGFGAVKSVTLADSVTTVGRSAFQDCTSLTAIDLAGVTTMGKAAFSGCTALTSARIPGSLTVISEDAFNGCLNLRDLTLSNGITEIGKYAFYNCRSLTKIILPESTATVGAYSFYNCKNLKELTFIGENEEWAAVTRGSYWDRRAGSATESGVYTFNARQLLVLGSGNCGASGSNVTWELTEDYALTISGTGNMQDYSITSVAPWYDYCNEIRTVKVESGVTKISAYSFRNCTALTSLTIADSVKTIASEAFVGCTAFKTFTIPAGVSSLGNSPLAGMDNLESITVSDGNTSFISKDGVLFSKDEKTLVRFPVANNTTTYAIPEGVTAIGRDAFLRCTKLTSVTIPASVTRVGGSVFAGCSSLAAISVNSGNTSFTDVDGVLYTKDMKTLLKYPSEKATAEFSIPEGVTAISADAFNNCKNLTAVNIPASVTSIGEYAFAGCVNVAKINYAGKKNAWTDMTKGDNWDSGVGSATSGGTYILIAVPSEGIAEGTFGNDFKWVIANDGTFSVTGTGAIGSYVNENTPWGDYRDEIKAVVVGDGITSVGDYAFSGYKNITSVTIGKDVADIGKNAFINCGKLAKIEVDADNTSYASANGVLYNKGMTTLICYPEAKADASFTVPSGVTSIISYAFRNCKYLSSVTISDSVTTIGNYAFWGSEKLSTVNIGKGTAAIGTWAFAYCDGLTAITVNASNKKYASSVDGVLYTKDMKTLVSYPVGKTETSFTVPAGVKRISNYAFYGCDSLNEITIPASVTVIGNNVFNYCDGLTAIAVNGANKKYTSVDGVLYTKDMTTLLYYPAGKTETEFTVPAKVKSIGKSAFENCDNLVTVNIGTNVTKIGYAAFAYCDALENINYAGIEMLWNAVSKGSYWNRYLDGDVVKFGA